MANFWIKLHHEILDDPKMGTMPDRLWRRAIELFLLAGRLGTDGVLPNTQQLAWILRMPSDELQGDLDQLRGTGIIEPIPNGWLVVNFEKRQEAVPDAERKAQQRKRDKSRTYYGDVTELSRNVTQNRLDIDIELDTEEKRGRENAGAPPPPEPADANDFDEMTPRQAERIPEIQTFNRATGRWPGRPTYRKVVETIRKHKLSVKTLKPYWEAWNERGYNPASLAWLTEWAVSGEIPKANGARSSPAKKGSGSRDEIQRIIAEAEAEERKNGKQN
jgi:hypothetical protein